MTRYVARVVDPARPFSTWHLWPLVPSGESSSYWHEPASSRLLWSQLEGVVAGAFSDEALFSGTPTERRRLLVEFRSYIRQASAYFDAATRVRGSSAALLYYYASLNLAKAELLRVDPGKVTGVRLSHGLNFSPTRARTALGDHLTVNNGVFRLLYKHQTGSNLPVGTRLDVKRLVSHCPEVGAEMGAAGFASPAYSHFIHGSVADATDAWSLVLLSDPNVLTRSSASTKRLIDRNYEQVQPPSLWRDIFAISRRWSGHHFSFFQSRWTVPISVPGRPTLELQHVVNVAADALRPLLDYTAEPGGMDGMLHKSLRSSELVPMPARLARYALMYYVSSLVRYKPGQLDPAEHPRQAWLFDCFCEQAGTGLLIGAVNGIRSRIDFYFPSDSFRL